MTNQEFESLVKKLDIEAAQKPKLYRMRVLLLTGLGFGYIFFFLALFLFLFALAIGMLLGGHFSFGSIKVLLIAGTLSFFMIKSLVVKMEMPDGYYVKKEEAPLLFSKIESLRLQMNASKIDEIVLDVDLNASVAQISKFGFWGRKKNILIIGVPLLTSLTEQQFVSVLAHELAHISHSDTAFSARIYRLRMSWGRLMRSLEENEQFGTFIFRKFFHWYYPRFDAYSFAMARQEEYAADLAAAKVTSPEIVGDTLAEIAIAAPYFYQDFFNELFLESSKTKEIPMPYSNFIEKYRTIDDEKSRAYLDLRLSETSYVTDTHPCLRDRLSSIGVEPKLPGEKKEDLALSVFFSNPGEILNYFNEKWVEHNQDKWLEKTEEFNQLRNRYEELRDRDSLGIDEWMEKAELTRDFEGIEAAVPLYESIIQTHREDDKALQAIFTLGSHYLELEEKASIGVDLIHEAMDRNWQYRWSGLDLLCGYYYETSQTQLFNQTKAELEKWEERLNVMEEESQYIYPTDQFLPHGKEENELELALSPLMHFHEIEQVFLVRKVMTAIPDTTLFVYALSVVLPKGTDLEEVEEEWNQKFAESLSNSDHFCVILLNGNKALQERIEEIETSNVFTRKEAAYVS